ncbi:MAG: SDR family oxidoreductase [Betaproteobacteria bacterium]|nr:SDR family oxidoreductase [Betaproteobacteria bacterium]NBY33048.1 SDR family oxidoreductase [Betaproteobacteria bacterium]
MKCLVTGGAGFIGSHLVDQLLDAGHDVCVVDNLSSGRLKNLELALQHPNCAFVQADIVDRNAIEPLFENIDWVFHLAGVADIVPSIENPELYFNVNVSGTMNVLQSAKNANIKKLIYAASSSSYGIPDIYPTPETSPINAQYPYALTKYMGEELVMHWSKVFGLSAISLRLFNVYGTRSRTSGAYGAVFGVFLAQKIKGHPLTVVGDGSQSRDFTYVTDVASAFIAAASSNASGEVFNVGSGNHYSVNSLVELLDSEVVYIPKRPGEPDCTFADVSKIQSSFGWTAKVDLQAGVSNMLAHLDDWNDAPVWNINSIDTATKTWFKYLGK